MAFRFVAATNRKFHKWSNKLFPKYTKKVRKLGLEVLTGKALSVWHEFIDETGEKAFVYKCKLSLALLCLAYMLINKLKVNLILFYWIVFNTKRIHNSFWRNLLERAKQMPSKLVFVGKKMRRPFDRSSRAEIIMRSLATANEWKIIIFELNYLTVCFRGSLNVNH